MRCTTQGVCCVSREVKQKEAEARILPVFCAATGKKRFSVSQEIALDYRRDEFSLSHRKCIDFQEKQEVTLCHATAKEISKEGAVSSKLGD